MKLLRHYKIKEDLYLVEQTIPQEKTESAKTLTTNHIWVYDRSYSMSYDLKQLAKDIIEKSKHVPRGDTISLGWFSGEGDFNFILKGFKITSDSDYSILTKAVENNKSPVSCTCFSEILADTKNVISDLSIFSDKFSLMFFTDGYPVVSNYSKEIESIFEAIKSIEGSISSSCLIGYGNYYNRDLMIDMAESLGGALVHNSDLHEFKLTLDDFIENASLFGNKKVIELDCPSTLDIVFSYVGGNSKTINIYKQNNDDNTISFVPVEEGDSVLFTLTETEPKESEEVLLDDNTCFRPTNREPFIKALYAASCILNQKTKTDLALETLSSLGDKRMLGKLNNAFTNSEYGAVEEKLRVCMSNPKERFEDGRDTNYLPPEDAFCLIDAVELLSSDSEAFFFPYHEDFKYKRIGVGSKSKGDYPKFVPNDNTKCEFSSLVWNKTRLNLSVRATINGTIKLKDDPSKFGFGESFPTHIFRNYSIVKDGFTHTYNIPMSLSKESYEKLGKEGVIWSNSPWEKDRVYNIELGNVPVMNRAIAKGKTSAQDLCVKTFKELELQGKLKVLNGIYKELTSNKDSFVDVFSGLTEDQVAYLEENGVTKNGFSPALEKSEPVDFYFAKDFSVKVKGFSALPSVNAVSKKIAGNKKLTQVDSLIQAGLDLYGGSGMVAQGDKVKVAWLSDEIAKMKSEMLTIRTDIQRTKFAIVVGKKWFDEFESREDNSIVVDGRTYNIVVEEKKVNI